MSGRTVEERFWSKVDKSGDCWEWLGAKKVTGYGLWTPGPNPALHAHRYAFQIAKGPISPGMYVDHICRNRGCVNPDHLRQVTPAQNSEHQDGQRGSISGIRGVSWHKPTGKWRARVTKNGKSHLAGYFITLEEAAEAAKALRLSLYTHNELDRRTA